MSNALNCQSCGGSNQLPEGKTSMFCSFCGNAIEQIASSQKEIESNIKSKPVITQRKVKTTKTTVDGEFPVTYRLGTFGHEKTHKIRKDGGWDVYDGSRWTFVRDEETEEEEVLDEGGKLILKDRGIKSLDEIISWFSDHELESIKYLDLSNNNISNLNGINKFSRAKEIILDGNSFTNLVFSDNQNKVTFSGNIILTNNPISEKDTSTEVPNNVILTSVPKCKTCKKSRNKSELETAIRVGEPDICSSCRRKKEKAESDARVKEMVFNDPQLKAVYTGPKKGPCFIATVAMGSYDHPQVMELRHFRDEWILTKNWGESFVKWYYHYGEKAAKVIDKSFVLKKFSYLLVVKPLVYLARIVKK